MHFINPAIILYNNAIELILIPTDLLDVIIESTKSLSSSIMVGSRL
jgi:hypothetical protein